MEGEDRSQPEPNVRHIPDQLEPLVEIGDAFAAQGENSVRQVEMQMRLGGVAAVADQPEDLTVRTRSPHLTRSEPGCRWA